MDGNQTAPAPLTATSYNSGDQTTGFTPTGPAPIAGAPTGPAPLTATYGGTGQNQRLSFGTTTYANGSQGVLSASTGGTSTYYERDPSGTLIAERGAGGEFYYITDGLGSTVALVDTTGTVQATYTYDPYGNTTTISGPNPVIANGNPFRYASGYDDTATGLYHFGQRYYNPTTGRWTQQDSLNNPLDPANGNRYAYTGGDPVNRTDPSGAISDCASAVLSTAGGAFALVAGLVSIGTGVGAPVGLIGANFGALGLGDGIDRLSNGACS